MLFAKSDNQKQIPTPIGDEPTVPAQMCKTPNLITKIFTHPSAPTKAPLRSENVQISKSDNQKQIPAPIGDEPTVPAQTCKTPNLITKIHAHLSAPSKDQAGLENVQISKYDNQKAVNRFERLRSQILERKDFIARDGNVAESWRIYRGKRIGPYYRVAFREKGSIKTIYIGRNEELAKMASVLIEELKNPHREDRLIRRARAAARAALRRSLADAETYLAPLGYYRRGLGLYKRR